MDQKIIRILKVVMGGGLLIQNCAVLPIRVYLNYYDFITLDDGEAPIENLLALEGRSNGSIKTHFYTG